MFAIQLGSKVRDDITGFEGIVTGRADYITGCRQYLITPKGTKTKRNDSSWFDEDRLRVLSVKKVSFPNKNDGGPVEFATENEGGGAPIK